VRYRNIKARSRNHCRRKKKQKILHFLSVTGDWRRLPNKELCDVYSSPDISQVIKSRLRWERHVARVKREQVHTGF
jgi:hypothetical protein